MGGWLKENTIKVYSLNKSQLIGLSWFEIYSENARNNMKDWENQLLLQEETWCSSCISPRAYLGQLGHVGELFRGLATADGGGKRWALASGGPGRGAVSLLCLPSGLESTYFWPSCTICTRVTHHVGPSGKWATCTVGVASQHMWPSMSLGDLETPLHWEVIHLNYLGDDLFLILFAGKKIMMIFPLKFTKDPPERVWSLLSVSTWGLFLEGHLLLLPLPFLQRP